jgi:Mg-chelatase subunit ChlD
MNNDGGDPPQPITDALQAAKKFATSLRPKDQAAVVTFATDAVLNQMLSTGHEQTASLIEALTIAPASEVGFTNTYEALATAALELRSERRNNDARRVIVLLTDGLPTTAGNDFDIVTETKTIAREIDEEGITIFAIGLGSGVDAQFVRDIASSEDNAFYAPTTEDLDNIYSEITSSLCESGTSQIDVIAKTRANFAPLR